MKELCEHFAVSRKTGYKWLSRYLEEGDEGLSDRNRAPHSCPHRTPLELEKAIIDLRLKKPRWGPKKISSELERTMPDIAWPAISTMGEVLKRAGLVRERKRRSRWAHPGPPTLVAEAPNEVWTIDFKGEFRLGDKTECYPLTIQDRWSRYVIGCDGMQSPTMVAVKESMTTHFRECGLPIRILSDNGHPFASHALAGLSRLNVWWMKLGIIHERTEKARPDQNGAHERMHRDLKAETTRPPAYNLEAQQPLFDDFRCEYNHHRPHEGIDQRRPAELWRPSDRTFPERLADPTYPGHFEVRRVRSGGEIKLKGMLFVSQALAGQLIGLEAVDDGIWSVIFNSTLIGRLDQRSRRIF
jgi:transposase InsO family protein